MSFSVFRKIRGTIETIFQIGLGGPQLKNNSGVIEARNSADAAFVIVRGATPSAANDLATKAYVDSGGASGAIQEIRFAIGTASTASTTQLPANAFVSSCTVEITTAYSGGATISVGQTGGSASLFQATTDNAPSQAVVGAANLFTVDQDTQASATPATVSVTIGGAPGAGVGVVIVQFSETLP